MENDIVKMLFFQRQRQKKRRKIKTISGAPPLSFKAKAGALKNYRIYGNTAGGEAVGDLETTGEHAGEYKVPVTVEGKNLYEITKFYDDSVSKTVSGITFTISNNKVIYSGTATDTYPQVLSPELPLIPGQSYYAKIIVKGSYEGGVYIFFRGSQVEGGTKLNYKQIHPGTEEVFTAWYNVSVLYVAQGNNRHFDASVEVVIAKVPSVTTPIYLPEPIKMVGDEADYIDYAEQKMHRIGADDIDVTLPALPVLPGTNTLTVGTAVQPSGVEITGRIKKGE